jgi:hypothetical protein
MAVMRVVPKAGRSATYLAAHLAVQRAFSWVVLLARQLAEQLVADWAYRMAAYWAVMTAAQMAAMKALQTEKLA